MMKIRTKIGQADHMGKWESACQIVRLVRDLHEIITEVSGPLEATELNQLHGVVDTFLATLPKKCRDELLHG